jgi:hypothetical protein
MAASVSNDREGPKCLIGTAVSLFEKQMPRQKNRGIAV